MLVFGDLLERPLKIVIYCNKLRLQNCKCPVVMSLFTNSKENVFIHPNIQIRLRTPWPSRALESTEKKEKEDIIFTSIYRNVH